MNIAQESFASRAVGLMDESAEEPQDPEMIGIIIDSLRQHYREKEIATVIVTRNGWRTHGKVAGITPEGAITVNGIKISQVEIVHIKHDPIESA